MSIDLAILILSAMLISFLMAIILYVLNKPTKSKILVSNLNEIALKSSFEVQESNTISLNPPLPFQIPPPPRDFLGREKEIQNILSDVEKGETIIALRGMPGIGKTTLALVLADKIKSQFPDGQLVIDMKGTSRNPLSIENAMAHVIHSYQDIGSPLPGDLNGLKGLYFSILSGKKILIVLDNAANREQIEPLLPPPGSAVIITSRNKFSMAGSKEIDLEILPINDAEKLIQEITGSITEQDSELARLCGCLPLALRIAASALKERPNISMAEYVAKLTDSRKRLGLVDSSFTLSYELLDLNLQKKWSLLAIFPADFDLPAATAIWDEKGASVDDALNDLVLRSLVDILPSPSREKYRYRLHELARDFAGSRLDETELVNAQIKYATYYKDILSHANDLFLKGGESMHEALELFVREWVNIQSGQSWSDKNKEKNSDALALCSSYFNAGTNLLNLRLHPRDLIKWLEAALVAARHKSNRQNEAICLDNLGKAYSHLAEITKAIEYYKNAYVISHEIGDNLGESTNLGNIGQALLQEKNYEGAIEYSRKALNISRELGDKRSEAIHLGNIGLAFSYKGDFEKAKEKNQKALSISREIGDRLGEANYQDNIGRAYLNNGNYHEALGYFLSALTISREIGDIRGEAKHLSNIGFAKLNTDGLSESKQYLDQALDISKKIGDKTTEKAIIEILNFKEEEKKISIIQFQKGIEPRGTIKND